MSERQEPQDLEQQLKELGRILKEAEEPEDTRWIALSEGSLSLQEMEQLKQESPEKYENYRPLTLEQRDRIRARFEKPASRLRWLSWPACSSRPALTFGLPLALACLLVFLLWPSSAIPPLHLEIHGGEAIHRSEQKQAALALLGPSTLVTFSVNAEDAGALEGRAYLRADEQLVLVTELARDGDALRAKGFASALFASAAPGPLAVVLVVGRPGEADVKTWSELQDKQSRGRVQVALKQFELSGLK